VVWFFANLILTLEDFHGGAWLGEWIAELRRASDEAGASAALDPAGGRFLRRMGYVKSLSELGEFGGQFTEYVAKAASRPPRQIGALINLFARGDPTLGKKPVCGATPVCQSKDGGRCGLSRDCDHYNRPRSPVLPEGAPSERLVDGLAGTLSDAEVLAVALFGDKGAGDEPPVSSLFERYGRLRAIFGAEAREYRGMREVKPAQALRLAAFAELHRRVLREKRGAVLRIASAKDFYDRYAAELRDYNAAAVLVLMDRGNNVIRDVWYRDQLQHVARLELSDLLRPVVRESAPRLALVHNHPSGDPTPSPADKDFTRRLKSACGIFGLSLVDHVVIAENGYFSFEEEGLLGAL
jgi:DNA repair protein RadC